MANIKVSEMPLATSVTPEDLIMLIQGGGNKKVTTNTLLGDSIVVSATEPTGNNRRKVWFRKGKNLFDKSKALLGYWISNEQGDIAKADNDVFITDFIPVFKNVPVYIPATGTARRQFYNKNKVGITYLNNSKAQVFTPTEDGFIRVTCVTSTVTMDSLMIYYGTTETEYEAYIEPKIYIKNSYDVYEEFIKKEEDVDYKPGEELIIPEGVIMPGNLTSGSSEVQCVFMTSKSLKNITNISIEDCLVVLRGINGYLDGNGTGIQLKGASNYTINTKIRNNAIIFSFIRTTKFDTTNNTPAVVYPISFKVILQ